MIEVKDLSFSYSREKVLDNISTVFTPGKIYGLLGANGVGKSTMFKLLCGLLTTKQGTIEIDASPFAELSARLHAQSATC